MQLLYLSNNTELLFIYGQKSFFYTFTGTGRVAQCGKGILEMKLLVVIDICILMLLTIPYTTLYRLL